MQELKESGAGVGEVAVLKIGPNFVYNLITKRRFWQKPTYETLRQSLESMKDHVVRNNTRELSMPRIGCGLDRLEWSKVKTVIRKVFYRVPVNITVYRL